MPLIDLRISAAAAGVLQKKMELAGAVLTVFRIEDAPISTDVQANRQRPS
jgi:hypothetical protein